MPLATLANLKALIDTTSTTKDDVLTRTLEEATALAERLVGVPAGGLQRSVDVVEFPAPSGGGVWEQTPSLLLARRPIESVSSVVQLWQTGTDADFTDEIEAGNELVENVDFTVDANMGTLTRINDFWQLGPRWIRVVYNAGYVDPAEESPPESSIQAPLDLQRAIARQALRWYQLRGLDGLDKILSLGGGAGIGLATENVHSALASVCQSMRRYV